MKPKWKGFLIVVACAVVLIAGYVFTRPATMINTDDFSRFLLESSVYSQGMKELSRSELTDRYKISGTGLSRAIAFAASDGTTREFAITEACDQDSADEIQKSFGLYCLDLEKRDWVQNPDEYARVRGFVIRRTRNYVIFTISDGEKSGDQFVDQYFERIHYDKG